MSKPVRLNKIQGSSCNYFSEFKNIVEAWCTRHALLIFSILMIILVFLFVTLVFALVGASATESGTVYNHFGDVI